VWANGRIRGIPTYDAVKDKVNTVSWLYTQYSQGKLDYAVLRLGLETWEKEAGNKRLTSFYIKPVFGYKLTDWAEAFLEIRANLDLAFQDGTKVAGEDPAMLDYFYAQPSVTFTLPGNFNIQPLYRLTSNSAKGLTVNADKSRIDHAFEVRFRYDF
jgi:hypothetical protein